MNKFRLLILIISLSFVCNSQTYWKIENEKGEEILLTISLNRENQTFIAHTRKEALKDIAGSITFMAAKTAGILKFPEIIHAEGKISEHSDTTLYSGSFIYLDKSFLFSAKTWHNSFKGMIADNKKRIIQLQGEKISSDKPLHDYPAIISGAFSLTERYYYDRNLIRSSEWRNFKRKLNEMESRIADDYEFFSAIYWTRRSIPDISFEIKKVSGAKTEQNLKKSYSLREIRPKTAMIDLSNLPDDSSEMEHIFEEIQKKKFTNLIIDARGRKNLQLPSALLLANHLNDDTGLRGAYITPKWTDSYSSIPKPSEYEIFLKNFRFLSENKREIFDETGCYLKPEAAIPVFKGKVYILINQRTSGVAEAFAIWIKNGKTGILVGQKSAGLPMLTGLLTIDKQYYLHIQVAQFYDNEGKCYHKNGVEPEIRVIHEDALSFLLRKID